MHQSGANVTANVEEPNALNSWARTPSFKLLSLCLLFSNNSMVLFIYTHWY